MSIFNISVIIGLISALGCGPDDSDGKRANNQAPRSDSASNSPAQAQDSDRKTSVSDASKTSNNDSDESRSDTSSNWTSKSGITKLLDDKAYENWWAEDEVHASSGPHGKVRTFINDILFDSIKEGNKLHPEGSIAVKELYNASGSKITGYATEVKISEGSSGDDWLWYENLGLDDGKVEFYGAGNRTCTGCHSQGIDFVTTSIE